MPYEWIKTAKAPEQSGAFSNETLFELHLWPYRSLPRRGFVAFIGGTAALFLLPLTTQLGSPTLWAILPFLLLALAGIWFALSRSYRDGEVLEILTATEAELTLSHTGRGRALHWQASPHWTHVALRESPVPDYLTLRAGEREVELGAFLSEDERRALATELRQALDVVTQAYR